MSSPRHQSALMKELFANDEWRANFCASMRAAGQNPWKHEAWVKTQEIARQAPEYKAAQAKAMKGKKNALGTERTHQQRLEMSKARTAWWAIPENKAMMREKRWGKK